MPVKRLTMTIIVLLLSLSTGILSVQAQDNLLKDPGFEDTNVKLVVSDEGSGTSFYVNASWNGWYTTSPRTASWQNLIPNGTGRNKTGAGFVRNGNRSQELSRGYATFTAAIYQTVNVTEGANLVGKAYYVMDLSLNDNPNSRARVGIDPNGGNNPFDTDVVWSSWGGNRLAGDWGELTVNATATGATATIYLYATQTVPSEQNGIFWDDASLVVGGPGGSNPNQPAAPAGPTATPVPVFAPAVSPQGAQDDGSIVHTVGPGDTVNSIAVAYGVPASKIIELNNLANPRLLSIGQKLLIKEATKPVEEPTATEEVAEETPVVTEEPTEEPTPEPTSTPAPTATPRPTSPPAPVAEADTETDLDLNATFATLCVLIYEDVNGDNDQQDDELSLAGGLISLQHDGEEIDSFVTSDSPEPSCFSGLEQGQYIVDAKPPGGYTLLPSGRSRPNLPAGQEVHIVFAAVDNASLNVPTPQDVPDEITAETVTDTTSEGDDNLMQYIGIAVFVLAGLTLLGGIGLGLMLRRR